MDERKEEIKRENKNALPKFIFIMLASLALGFFLGIGMLKMDATQIGSVLADFGSAFAERIAPCCLWLCVLLVPAVGMPMYFRCKRRIAKWDGENEAESDAIDQSVSLCLWVSSVTMILSLFFAAASFTNLMQGVPPGMALLCAVGLFLSLIVHAVYQQKLVDLAKALYPEKKGSVYDMRFKKKWMDSCDEAEVAVIGQCAVKAMNAANTTCMALWVMFTLAGMVFDIGFLPALCLCAVWIVSQSVYCYWSMKLG